MLSAHTGTKLSIVDRMPTTTLIAMVSQVPPLWHSAGDAALTVCPEGEKNKAETMNAPIVSAMLIAESTVKGVK